MRCMVKLYLLFPFGVAAVTCVVLLFVGKKSWHPLIRDCQNYLYGPGAGLCYDDVWGDEVKVTLYGNGLPIQKDNRTRVTRWLWTYDERNRLIKEDDPSGMQRNWAFDETTGQLTAYADTNGTRIMIVYGQDGQPSVLVSRAGTRCAVTAEARRLVWPPAIGKNGARTPRLDPNDNAVVLFQGP